MRKKLGIILVSILVAAIAIGGGTWHHMEKVKQEKKEEAIEKREEQKLIKKSAQEIDDFYKWNYIGVKKTTTGKLWTNPASGELELDYTVYLDSGSSDTLNAEWDKKGNILLLPYSKDVEKKPQAKVPETEEYNDKADKYLLQSKDINKLKKKGYTKKITGSQIRSYLIRTYPGRF